ncbi:MAG: hypothetical protein QXW77_03630 [Candidatus Hadarchaeales archaeon]
MPEVYVNAKLQHGAKEIDAKLLLNSGGVGAELVIPQSLAKKLELKPWGRAEVSFGGRKLGGKTASVKVTIKNQRTGEERVSILETIVLPDKIIDVPLLGVVAQEKLRITPNVPTGEVLFV